MSNHITFSDITTLTIRTSWPNEMSTTKEGQPVVNTQAFVRHQEQLDPPSNSLSFTCFASDLTLLSVANLILSLNAAAVCSWLL